MAFLRRKLVPAVRPVPPQVSLAARRSYEVYSAPHAGEPLRVLVVCTANVCRSPLAAALLSSAFAARDVAAHVTSAGVAAAALPVDPRSVRFAERHNYDISAHRSRQVTPEIIARDGRDLIVGMTREHVRELILLERSAARRTYTIPELTRRAAELPPTGDEELLEWIDRIGANRRATDLLGDGGEDEIIDPYGRSDALFASVAEDLERWCKELTRMVEPA